MRNSPASRPVRNLVEHLGGQLPAPPEHAGQIGRCELAGCCQDEQCELAARLVDRRQPLRQRPLPVEQVVRDGAPAGLLLDEMGAREHQAAVQDGKAAIDVTLRRADDPAQSRPGQRPLRADRRHELELERARLRRVALRDERRQRARRDTRRHPRDVLADTGEAASRQLVLRPPEQAQLGRPADERPIGLAHGEGRVGGARDLRPERGQDDVRLREEEGDPDLVDPAGRGLQRLDH